MRRFLLTLLKVVGVLVLGLALLLGAGRLTAAWLFPPPNTAAVGSTDAAVLPSVPPGVTATRVNEGSVQGFHLVPAQRLHPGLVVVFGGSEGSANPMAAGKIAEQGFEVLALFFFGQANQPAQLSRVPLEFFGEVLAWSQRTVTSPTPLTVLGVSKGAELALLLPTYYAQITNVVAYAPADHVYQGLDYSRPTSSWTWQGTDVPYVAFTGADPAASTSMFAALLVGWPAHLRATYASALAHATNAEAARIKVDGYGAKLLLFAGELDAMWPSDEAARAIQARRPDSRVVIYPDAGHVFALNGYAGSFALGGTQAGNDAARSDSNRILTEQLISWHGTG